MNHFALCVGYVFIAIAAVYLLYLFAEAVAEALICAENRFLIAVKLQPALIKYFRNRKQIDAILKAQGGIKK